MILLGFCIQVSINILNYFEHSQTNFLLNVNGYFILKEYSLKTIP